MEAKYRELLNFKYTGVKKHIPADRMARAAQFSAFAALSGHDKYLRETERQNEDYHENLYRGKFEDEI